MKKMNKKSYEKKLEGWRLGKNMKSENEKNKKKQIVKNNKNGKKKQQKLGG